MSNATTFNPTTHPMLVYGFIVGEVTVLYLLYTVLGGVLGIRELL